MSMLMVRGLVALKEKYQQQYGKAHPLLDELPPELQEELLKEALNGTLVLDENSISAMVADVPRRVAIVQQLAAFIQ